MTLGIALPVLAAQTRAPVAPSLFRQTAKAYHASAIAMDLPSRAVVLAVGSAVRGLPGSAIKPLLLQYALAHGIVQPGTEVYCRRHLVVAGKPLPCTHPADRTVFTAETALADSCNTWFAHMGARFTSPQLDAAFDQYGLPHAPFRALTVEQRELLALGLSGPRLSLSQLAQAYASLLEGLGADSPVAKGLLGSVRYGMARPAGLDGQEILGKTGTASDPGEVRTHGWFVGAVPGHTLVAIYVPNADGGTAARLGQLFFREPAISGHPR